MMQYLQAKTLLTQKKILMVVCRLDVISPLLLFELDSGRVRVSYNHKGWVSDWVEEQQHYEMRCIKAEREGRPRPERSSSVFQIGKEDDVYILACKLFIKQLKIPTDEQGNPKLE